MNKQKPKCGDLVWRAKDSKGLKRLDSYSDLWHFVEMWIRKFHHTNEDNAAEKFIYLWVTVNAWASMVVPDITKNHVDAYLVHCLAQDKQFKSLFLEKLTTNPVFQNRVNKLISMGPVFQVIWLRNNNIRAWDIRQENRLEYVKHVREHNPYHELGSGNKIAAFAPSCAFEHLDLGEPLPNDWPHVLSIIYQIRCNLFHGGKNYMSDRDRHFIKLAYSILWDIWNPVIPTQHLRNACQRKNSFIKNFKEVNNSIEWERALIRSGFRVTNKDEKLLLLKENSDNIKYLKKILKEISMDKFLDENKKVFNPPTNIVNKNQWLNIIEAIHSGAEGGNSSIDNIDLQIMDTFMAGVVRWINALGIDTHYSCDGHGQKNPKIYVNNKNDVFKFKKIISIASNNVLIFNDKTNEIVSSGHKSEIIDRKKLLDVAENLHVFFNDN